MKFFAVLALCIVGAIAAPLSADQAASVRASWAKVKNNEVDILYFIFKAHPDIMAKFPQFAGKNIDSLKDTASFATHAGRIVGFVSEIVALMGSEANAPAMKTLVTEMANNHKARGIPKAQFNEFRASLVEYLQAHVTWNDNLGAAWNQGLDNVFNMIFAII